MESERGMLEGEGEGISLFHASVKTVIAEVLSYVDGSASPEAQVLKVWRRRRWRRRRERMMRCDDVDVEWIKKGG